MVKKCIENETIEKQVKTLLSDYGYSFDKDTYVDIVDFVQKLGFVVGNAKLDKNEDGFLAIQSGYKVKNSNGEMCDKLIGVNAEHALEWKRFVVAHEFAHYILHYNEGDLYLHRENKKGKNSEENEADYFAAALLMPKDSFLRMYQKYESEGMNRNTISLKLASVFKVPLDSIVRRIGEVVEL